jgi:hypothetical protein
LEDDLRHAESEVVVVHSDRVTLRVGDVFLKIDTDQARKPPVLALGSPRPAS